MISNRCYLLDAEPRSIKTVCIYIIVYLVGITAMPSTSLPKSPNKSVDMANNAMFERKIGLPDQGPVAKYP